MRREMLTLADREEISRCLAADMQQKDIATAIGRDPSVVSREITRHGGCRAYRAHRADTGARKSRMRPKHRKIDADPQLRERVLCDFRKARSPQQISGRLCYERSRGETDMSVSHEAIYTWLYALPKGELAEMEIALRTGRTRRQPRGRSRSKGARIVGMVSISQRPATRAEVRSQLTEQFRLRLVKFFGRQNSCVTKPCELRELVGNIDKGRALLDRWRALRDVSVKRWMRPNPRFDFRCGSVVDRTSSQFCPAALQDK
jgi:IS30 family transposase